jgi:hypothetical protein
VLSTQVLNSPAKTAHRTLSFRPPRLVVAHVLHSPPPPHAKSRTHTPLSIMKPAKPQVPSLAEESMPARDGLSPRAAYGASGDTVSPATYEETDCSLLFTVDALDCCLTLYARSLLLDPLRTQDGAATTLNGGAAKGSRQDAPQLYARPQPPLHFGLNMLFEACLCT